MKELTAEERVMAERVADKVTQALAEARPCNANVATGILLHIVATMWRMAGWDIRRAISGLTFALVETYGIEELKRVGLLKVGDVDDETGEISLRLDGAN